MFACSVELDLVVAIYNMYLTSRKAIENMIKPKNDCPECNGIALTIKDKLLKSNKAFNCLTCNLIVKSDKLMLFLVTMVMIAGFVVAKRTVDTPISAIVFVIFYFLSVVYVVPIVRPDNPPKKITYFLVFVAGLLASMATVYIMILLKLIYSR